MSWADLNITAKSLKTKLTLEPQTQESPNLWYEPNWVDCLLKQKKNFLGDLKSSNIIFKKFWV